LAAGFVAVLAVDFSDDVAVVLPAGLVVEEGVECPSELAAE
jgi:hypothetical protein